jgi:hypothetical protein
MTKIEFSVAKDNYFMDVENEVLHCWDNLLQYPVRDYLVGTKRLSCEPWLELIGRHLEDGYFDQYLVWVSQGGGDEWFVDE